MFLPLCKESRKVALFGHVLEDFIQANLSREIAYWQTGKARFKHAVDLLNSFSFGCLQKVVIVMEYLLK